MMNSSQELVVVQRITEALKNRRGLSPALRSEVLRLPRAARKEAGMRLAVFSLSLLAEDPEEWRLAIVTVGDLLHLIESSLQTTFGDGFDRGSTRH